MASLAVGRFFVAVPRRIVGTSSKRELSTLLTAVEEYPGIPTVVPTQAKASSASVTTLSNGVTVVTEDASSTSTVTMTYPKAGSADEKIEELGAALATKCMAFKSGSGLSTLVILRNLENYGAASFATAGRRGATVGFTAARDKALYVAPLLLATCDFELWDIRDAKGYAAAEVKDANSNAQAVLTEQVFAAAYGAQSNMGRPYYAPDASADAIKSFHSRAYSLKGAVLTATGISDHEAFVRGFDDYFSVFNEGSDDPPASASYIGGEARVFAPSSGYAHVALAFEGPTSSALSNVMKHCLTLSGEGSVSGFAATGLVGVYGGAASASSSGVADALCDAVAGASSPDIVKRGKALAKAEALFALDSGSKTLAEYMTASILESGTFSIAGLAESYDKITEKDVTAAFSAMTKRNPALAAVGDISLVPYHATIAARFK